MTMPAHIEATVETTRRFRCHRCGSRLILGGYDVEGRAEQVLADWLARHAHPPAPP